MYPEGRFYKVVDKDILENERRNLRKELSKRYTPRKPVICTFHLISRSYFKKGSQYNIGLKSKEAYLENPYDLDIDLLAQDGTHVGTSHETSKNMRILKTYYNDYQFIVVVKGWNKNSNFFAALDVEVEPYK